MNSRLRVKQFPMYPHHRLSSQYRLDDINPGAEAGESVAENVIAAGEWVRKSGFTSHTTGEWLLRPLTDLPASPTPNSTQATNGDDGQDGNGLLFLQSSDLQRILENQLSPSSVGTSSSSSSSKVTFVSGKVASVCNNYGTAGAGCAVGESAGARAGIGSTSTSAIARVQLENGDTIEADLVVGADGLRSVVRKVLRAANTIPLTFCTLEDLIGYHSPPPSPIMQWGPQQNHRYLVGSGRPGVASFMLTCAIPIDVNRHC